MPISTARSLGELMEASWGRSDSLQGLDAVVGAIADGARMVQEQVQAAALAGVLGATGETNVQGEAVQKLDAAGSDIFVETLIGGGSVAAVGSEEIEEPVIGGNGSKQTYIVQMDPVDGSSNIDVAVTIGSIFGIWKPPARRGRHGVHAAASRTRAGGGLLRRVRLEHDAGRGHAGQRRRLHSRP